MCEVRGMENVTVYANSLSYKEIMKRAASAQLKVADQAFRDCTRYCKKDTGKLMASGKVERSSGTITWDTDYARAAYYTGNPDRSKNPFASLMWAHKAAQLCGAKWKALVERELFL